MSSYADNLFAEKYYLKEAKISELKCEDDDGNLTGQLVGEFELCELNEEDGQKFKFTIPHDVSVDENGLSLMKIVGIQE